MTGSPFRLRFLEAAFKRVGVPYIWSGKGEEGLDCSGLVTLSLFVASGGSIDWRFSHNAERLWEKLSPVTEPRPGDVCCYGPPARVEHVMVYIRDDLVLGAAGGNHTTTDANLAERANAYVKLKPSVKYRPDFRGFRQLVEMP